MDHTYFYFDRLTNSERRLLYVELPNRPEPAAQSSKEVEKQPESHKDVEKNLDKNVKRRKEKAYKLAEKAKKTVDDISKRAEGGSNEFDLKALKYPTQAGDVILRSKDGSLMHVRNLNGSYETLRGNGRIQVFGNSVDDVKATAADWGADVKIIADEQPSEPSSKENSDKKNKNVYSIEFEGTNEARMKNEYGLTFVDKGEYHDIQIGGASLATVSSLEKGVVVREENGNISLTFNKAFGGTETAIISPNGAVVDSSETPSSQEKHTIPLSSLIDTVESGTGKSISLKESIKVDPRYAETFNEAKSRGINLVIGRDGAIYFENARFDIQDRDWQKKTALHLRSLIQKQNSESREEQSSNPDESLEQNETVKEQDDSVQFKYDVELNGLSKADLKEIGVVFDKNGVLRLNNANGGLGKSFEVESVSRKVVLTKNGDNVTLEVHDNVDSNDEYKVDSITLDNKGESVGDVESRQEKATEQEIANQKLVDALKDSLKGSPLGGYKFSIKNNRTITVNPVEVERTRGGLGARKTLEGGFDLSLAEGTTFKSMKWESGKTLKELVSDPAEQQKLTKARYGLNTKRAVLRWEADGDSGYIVLSKDSSDKGMISICEGGGVQVLEMEGGVGRVVLRKPVIYLYPEKQTQVRVDLKLSGANVVAEYPKMQNNGWDVIASSDGTLQDTTTKKEYSYLFWEAQKDEPYQINAQDAFCVEGTDVELFLEEALTTLGLNVKERNDFMVYWLPHLEGNLYNLISFLNEEYTNTAELTITPSPDALIRIFMIFEGIESPIDTSPTPLKSAKRSGFTVVEWGGVNLDELTMTHPRIIQQENIALGVR